jgi:NAD(P) transhydrogenase subunit alpha
MGISVSIEREAGLNSYFLDTDYEKAGAVIVEDRKEELAQADLVARVRKPPVEEVPLLKSGAMHISFLDPFNERDLINAFAGAGVTAVSMEMIPRTTLAQKMDALSSQANLAGYFAVVKASERLNRILPMMMTPA